MGNLIIHCFDRGEGNRSKIQAGPIRCTLCRIRGEPDDDTNLQPGNPQRPIHPCGRAQMGELKFKDMSIPVRNAGTLASAGIGLFVDTCPFTITMPAPEETPRTALSVLPNPLPLRYRLQLLHYRMHHRLRSNFFLLISTFLITGLMPAMVLQTNCVWTPIQRSWDRHVLTATRAKPH